MVLTSVFSLTSSFHLFSRIFHTVASVPSFLPSDSSFVRSLLLWEHSLGLFSDSPSSNMYSISLVFFQWSLFSCSSLICQLKFLVDRTSLSFSLSMWSVSLWVYYIICLKFVNTFFQKNLKISILCDIVYCFLIFDIYNLNWLSIRALRSCRLKW